MEKDSMRPKKKKIGSPSSFTFIFRFLLERAEKGFDGGNGDRCNDKERTGDGKIEIEMKVFFSKSVAFSMISLVLNVSEGFFRGKTKQT